MKNCPRFVLAGAHSGVGKTSVTVAILGAMREKGIFTQPYKIGPDYVDPAFHTFVTGVPSRNLDAWLVAPDELKKLFVKTAPEGGVGVSVIEGVMGMFDGNGTTSEGGTSHVARVLSAPVVLVVNGEGIGRSLGALVMGYRDFDREVDLAGVIVNRVSGAKHYRLLKDVVEGETGIRCYGYLTKKADVALAHRPLGLIPPAEVDDMRLRLDVLASMALETIDLEGLGSLAAGATEIDAEPPVFSPGSAVRLGVPRDGAFYAYYEDNIDLLRALGAEIIFFDTTHDCRLPEDLDGLYIGGGSPEIFAPSISENATLRGAIRDALEGGMPAYAEGAGSAYLCRNLVCGDGASYPMAGFIERGAYVASRLPNFGHITVTLNEDTPLGECGTSYRANEFHRLEIRPLASGDDAPAAYGVRKTNGVEWEGGVVKKNTFASLAQVHFYANTKLAENFLGSCRRYGNDNMAAW